MREALSKAASIGFVRGIRTFAQSAASGLLTITTVNVTRPGLVDLGVALTLVAIFAALAFATAFLQNFAENLPAV